MLPDYRSARALGEIRLKISDPADRNRSENAGKRPFIEQADLRIEAKLHERRDTRRNRPSRRWHWPHPLSH